MTVGEDAEGSVASKASLIRNSDGLLSLVGEIIHGDSEYWVYAKQHDKGFLFPLRTCTRSFKYNLKLCHDRAACPTVFLRSEADLKLKLAQNEFIYSARAMNSMRELATES
jgi:hypothetical protein